MTEMVMELFMAMLTALILCLLVLGCLKLLGVV